MNPNSFDRGSNAHIFDPELQLARIQELEGEVSFLQQENDLLRRRLEELSRPRTAEAQRTIPGAAIRRGTHRGAESGDTTWRTPRLASSDEYSQHTQTGLRYAGLGRPLLPEEAPAPLLPPLAVAAPQNDLQGLDLGYVNRAQDAELDTLPYGLIVVDSRGEVLFYNETESRLTGFARERILGRNFFQDIAPCTRVREFEGRFRDFVEGRLGRVTFFDFAFHFERGTQRVLIAFSAGRRPGCVNIMMMRR